MFPFDTYRAYLVVAAQMRTFCVNERFNEMLRSFFKCFGKAAYNKFECARKKKNNSDMIFFLSVSFYSIICEPCDVRL